MDAETVAMLRRTVHHVLETTSGEAAVSGLDDLGWDEVLADDERTCTEILFDTHGRTLARSPALDTVVLGDLGFVRDTHRVLYPTHGVDPTCVIDADGRHVDVSGWLLGDAGAGRRLVACCAAPDGSTHVVTLDATPLAREAVTGVDESLGLVQVTGSTAVEPDAARLVDDEWLTVMASAQRAVSAEIVAVAQVMLDLAVEHARTREQFGRPIGTFQAVKHHLAEAHVAITGARLALEEAWDTRHPLSAALAKALAGDAAGKAHKEGQQILAAIGFTWEHDFHRYVRRSMALDGLLGSAASLRRQMGASFATGWRVPRIGVL